MRLSVAMCCVLAWGYYGGLAVGQETAKTEGMKMNVGVFEQEVARSYGTADGLPDGDVYSIEVTESNNTVDVCVGTAKGLASFSGGSWTAEKSFSETRTLCSADGAYVLCGRVLRNAAGAEIAKVPEDINVNCLSRAGADVYLGAEQGLFQLKGGAIVPVEEFNNLLGKNTSIRAIASGPMIAVAAMSGLYVFSGKESPGYEALYPANAKRSWAPYDVRGVAWDSQGGLWFASPQGVGCRDAYGGWKLCTAQYGLPYNYFTCVAAGEDGVVWFGTNRGAIRFDGQHWAYRQGRRWLPDDHVRAIAVTSNGDAWFATANGVGVIERKPMTFAEKAKYYEDEIDKYNRRTPYGYVIEANLKTPGDRNTAETSDSDNDGLWTSMYGAGECFAYAATKDPLAKKRAKDAFEALRFLGVVTQGGDPPALPGFVARSILPTSGPDPNAKDYTREKDIETQKSDALWKVISPRWPKSADGKWYWKCDTSSDELDGHFFFYAAYYDLVADTEEEKARVREVVAAIADHFLAHDFNMVDWDGTPTRWAIYSPKELNHNPAWFPERGLNSLSMLSYLSVAEHVTGDPRYGEAVDRLVNEHGYAMNMMFSKFQAFVGGGNQSDDEMAFMSFYDLVKYTKDPKLRAMAGYAFLNYWILEEPELNPLFNFMCAGVCAGNTFQNQWGLFDLTPKGAWLEQSIDTLKRFTLDLCDWSLTNSHRIDIIPLASYTREGDGARGKGYRRNGLVLPVDERHFNHWNCDPWELDQKGKGHGLSDGAVFLLPYYLGLYHGFIIEEGK